MDKIINHKAIDSYCNKLAQEISNSFFSSQDAARGEDLMKLTSINQINLLILKTLFLEWERETEKIKSPYFDFNHPEVNETFTHLKNLLSNNIKIGENHFPILLTKGLKDSILLHFFPSDFFAKEIYEIQQDEITLEDIQGLERFIKTNEEYYQFLANSIKENNDAILKETLLIQLTEFHSQQGHINNEDKLIEMFSKLSPLDIPTLYKENPANNEGLPSPKIAPQEARDEDIEALIDEQENAQEILTNNISAEKESSPQEQEGNTLVEQLETQTETINDKLSNTSPSQTIGEDFEKQGITSIYETITINQRFMFINELFNGNSDAFMETVKQLDLLSSFEETSVIINTTKETYAWEEGIEEVNEFISIVKRKFS